MMKLQAILFLALVVVMQLLPFCVILIHSYKRGRRGFVFGLISAFVLFILIAGFHVKFLHYVNPKATILYILNREFSYDSVKYFGYVALIQCVFLLLFWMTAEYIIPALASTLNRKLKSAKLKGILGLESSAKAPAINRKTSLLVISIELLYAACILSMCDSAYNSIRINEICPYNQALFVDASDDTPDFIELYNPGIFACRTDKLYLSDDNGDLTIYSIGENEIGGDGYLMIRVGDDLTGFSLSRKGENVYC